MFGRRSGGVGWRAGLWWRSAWFLGAGSWIERGGDVVCSVLFGCDGELS